MIFGGVLLAIALFQPMIKRLPITTSIVYLLVGVALGPLGAGLLRVDLLGDSAWLHHGAEIAVIVSLFAVGVKSPLSLGDPAMRPALGLALVSMALTVAMLAGIGVWLLGLELGAAVLLGAVLAPTDPVLASDVQLRHAKDRDRVRVTLSLEAGLNDGTAFPLVMLGLGLLGLHHLGEFGARWMAVDVIWAVAGGLGIGAVLGATVGRLVLRLQARHGGAGLLGEYLVIGLIGVAYGSAVLLQAYGFLAVFAAGVALRMVERRAVAAGRPAVRNAGPRAELAQHGAAELGLTSTLLSTNEQLEHILEALLVVVVGASLAQVTQLDGVWWLAGLLFFLVRPLGCAPVLIRSRFSRVEFGAVSWFGIRGIGSLYYVMYAVDHGLPPALAERLVSLTLVIIALSIVAHGVSVTPFLHGYENWRERRQSRPPSQSA